MPPRNILDASLGVFPTPRERGVSDGTRTRDILDHNQVLYQLSYTHHTAASPIVAASTALPPMVAKVVSGSPRGHLSGARAGRRARFVRAGPRFGHEHGAPVVGQLADGLGDVS